MNRSGFTFIEMCIAMSITAMTGLAIFAFASVTTKTWSATEHGHQLDVTALQAGALMTNMVERSRALAHVSSTPPRAFLWMTDAFGGASDGQAQFAEMALIEYDAASKSIYLYHADLDAAQTAGEEADDVVSAGEMTNTGYATLLKSMDWLAPRRTLLGPGREVDAGREITRVESAAFIPIVNDGLPAFEMNATLSRGTEQKQVDRVFVLRAPTLRPDYANPNE